MIQPLFGSPAPIWAPVPPTIPMFQPSPLLGLTPASLLAAVSLRRGQPQGPTTDQEIEEFIYEALDMIPGAADVEIRVDAGRVTQTGNVQHKRVKHDIGEIAWAIPGVQDVQNNVTIMSRRRARNVRDGDGPQAMAGRKQG